MQFTRHRALQRPSGFQAPRGAVQPVSAETFDRTLWSLTLAAPTWRLAQCWVCRGLLPPGLVLRTCAGLPVRLVRDVLRRATMCPRGNELGRTLPTSV